MEERAPFRLTAQSPQALFTPNCDCRYLFSYSSSKAHLARCPDVIQEDEVGRLLPGQEVSQNHATFCGCSVTLRCLEPWMVVGFTVSSFDVVHNCFFETSYYIPLFKGWTAGGITSLCPSLRTRGNIKLMNILAALWLQLLWLPHRTEQVRTKPGRKKKERMST